MKLHRYITTAVATALASIGCLSSSVAANGFSGPFIGMSGYYGWADMDAKVERISLGHAAKGVLTREGPSLAAFAGYDWRIGEYNVFGINADIGAAKFGAKADFTAANLSSGNSYVTTLRGRLGHIVGHNTMLYGTAGIAFLNSDLSGRLGGHDYSLSGWVPGWAVGGGLEHRRNFAGHPIRIGLEVMYLDFVDRKFEVPDRRATLDYTGWTVGARVAYEFNRQSPSTQPMK